MRSTSDEPEAATLEACRSKLAKAKKRLREGSATFVNVGRLHAFFEGRGRGDGNRVNAPLHAMKYIRSLEKACDMARLALQGDEAIDVERLTGWLVRLLPSAEQRQEVVDPKTAPSEPNVSPI